MWAIIIQRWEVKSVCSGVVGVQMQMWGLCENASLWKVPHGIPAVTAGAS